MWATAGATWATTPVTALEYASSISSSAACGSWRGDDAARASPSRVIGREAILRREELMDRKMVPLAAAFKHSVGRSCLGRCCNRRVVDQDCQRNERS